jgi:hypothetical protein
MGITDVTKFRLALVLLLSSLSSAPMASMEQSVVAVAGQTAEAHPHPQVRVATGAAEAAKLSLPSRSEPPRGPATASSALPARQAPARHAAAGRRCPARAAPGGAVPLCERLPYSPNAPPLRSTGFVPKPG